MAVRQRIGPERLPQVKRPLGNRDWRHARPVSRLCRSAPLIPRDPSRFLPAGVCSHPLPILRCRVHNPADSAFLDQKLRGKDPPPGGCAVYTVDQRHHGGDGNAPGNSTNENVWGSERDGRRRTRRSRECTSEEKCEISGKALAWASQITIFTKSHDTPGLQYSLCCVTVVLLYLYRGSRPAACVGRG